MDWTQKEMDDLYNNYDYKNYPLTNKVITEANRQQSKKIYLLFNSNAVKHDKVQLNNNRRNTQAKMS